MSHISGSHLQTLDWNTLATNIPILMYRFQFNFSLKQEYFSNLSQDIKRNVMI